MVINDVIAFYPRTAKGSMHSYARRYGVDWLRARQSQNENGDILLALEEKEAAIQAHSKSLKEKEALIQELAKKVSAYRSTYSILRYVIRPAKHLISAAHSFAHQLRNVLGPRLGNLNQHAPRELRLPPHYAQSVHVAQPPSIAIVTPSFKQAKFIERTIRSVLDQSYPNLEYHVQDGGSEDGTKEILERYADRLARWESRADRGQAQAINLGFAKTSGEIMAWLNSDDILLPGALAYVAAYFNQHPGIDVVYGHRILIDESDQEIGRWVMPAHDDEVLSWADYIPQETLFWRRRIWDKAGGQVDESFRFAMDWDLLVRFRAAGAVFHPLPRFLGAFRIHPQQKTSAEISDIGFAEMSRIRERELGRRVSQGEVRKAVSMYLLRHLVQDRAYRIKHALGIATQ
jgi:GT2 family glycosyltransferase